MTKMAIHKTEYSSFRDPNGFLFYSNGILYRQISKKYTEHFEHFIKSGLLNKLVAEGMLIPHENVGIKYALTSDAYAVIHPEKIEFISYPYEWCFSQIKDAALLTLKIQQIALEHGMSLKDCSAYNVQFRDGKPIFIDTLSFEKYHEGSPWIPYRQFCQHFLAPLALMAYTDIKLNQLLRIYIDGIPLDLASSLLPYRTRWRFSLLSHIHIHAKMQDHYKEAKVRPDTKMSKIALLGLVDSLLSSVNSLTWKQGGTEWGDYYDKTNYSARSFEHKQSIVSDFLEKTNSHTVWDLGANAGVFSREASKHAKTVISFDIDPAAVEKNYLECLRNGYKKILPLILDLTNPSPGIGWANRERMSISDRGPADTALALALIHHLAISNNLPLAKIAEYFSTLCDNLIIEFIPKSDSYVQKLLKTREDIFDEYNQENFEKTFSERFTIEEVKNVTESERLIYKMKNRQYLTSE